MQNENIKENKHQSIKAERSDEELVDHKDRVMIGSVLFQQLHVFLTFHHLLCSKTFMLFDDSLPVCSFFTLQTFFNFRF